MRDHCWDKGVRHSFNELMYHILQEFKYPDLICKPRGMEIKEILVPRLVLTNPRDRILHNEARNPNYGFAVGEFLWYWRGAQDLETMAYYNKRMPQFSDDGKTLNSAYGYRLRSWQLDHKHGLNQWGICKKTLIDDSDSRRAVMHINDPRDQRNAVTIGSKDVPCTLTLQFFIREEKLHLHVNMRSNDVHWGLTYDLFSFTMLQECMMLELRDVYPHLKLGRYIHTAGSLHVYDRHYDMSERMIECFKSKDRIEVPAMKPLKSIEELNNLCELEECLRKRKPLPKKINLESPTALWMWDQLVKHREKRDKE